MDPIQKTKSRLAHHFSLFSDDDIYLFNEGSHFLLYEKLGAHSVRVGEEDGTYFAVWAPSAEAVSVMGEFNGWQKGRHSLQPRGHSGIWEGFVPGLESGTIYKYHITSRENGYQVDKADPYAFYAETPPSTASVVWDLEYSWGDRAWVNVRGDRNALVAPMAIYEMHLGSWMRVPEERSRHLTYRELAPRLAEYVLRMGFTHVEFLPVMEHPFYGSWGYQTTGYFAPTSRYGTPQDFMYLIDHLHQNEIGVILDWVPSHFPSDEHGLAYFDGTHLYEHSDPKKGFHPDWKSYIFNYGRKEIPSFLVSSALFWLDKYHVDGLRVDAVASMLYLDYSRKKGEWIPNQYGGRENLEAIAFLRRLNEEVYRRFPDTQTIAEESTAWPMVSKPTHVGGLGFGMKWDMGWMHDSLEFMKKDPVHREYHHNLLTFRMIYAFNENFVLPLSHDEVVHGKGSLLGIMSGDDWQKFSNLRVLYGLMYAQPGKKLLFMGDEFGQWNEWSHEGSLDWHLLDFPPHEGLSNWVRDLNRLLRSEPSLHSLDFSQDGFEWIDGGDSQNSVISFLRKENGNAPAIFIICNFTPVPRLNYRVGIPHGGSWKLIANSDSSEYGGSGHAVVEEAESETISSHGRDFSVELTLPPLSVLFLKNGKVPG